MTWALPLPEASFPAPPRWRLTWPAQGPFLCLSHPAKHSAPAACLASTRPRPPQPAVLPFPCRPSGVLVGRRHQTHFLPQSGWGPLARRPLPTLALEAPVLVDRIENFLHGLQSLLEGGGELGEASVVRGPDIKTRSPEGAGGWGAPSPHSLQRFLSTGKGGGNLPCTGSHDQGN